MTDSEYFSKQGLSDSAMRDMMVSPLRFWWMHVRPDREPITPTPEMIFGSALHCAVLESEQEFDKRYACEVNPVDYPDLLVTIDDIRKWCTDKGSPAKGTRKDDVIRHALSLDKDVSILQEIERRHAAENQGKEILPLDSWTRLDSAVRAFKDEPSVQKLLSNGKSEVPYFVQDPASGIGLKAKMDWVAPDFIVDLKTFSQQRGKSIDRCVNDAIWYEQYYRKAFFYSMVRAISEGENWATRKSEFVLVFVESTPPHEVRIKMLRPKFAGNANLFWERGRIEVMDCIRKYKEYMENFGPDKPWRYAAEIDTLQDEELPTGLSYAT